MGGGAFSLVLLLEACGSSSCPPSGAPSTRIEPTSGDDEEREESAPALSGTYRIESLAGEPVVQSLVRDPSCYAGRALFVFGADETLTFSLETACAGSDRYETVCTAELTTAVEWEGDSFRVPFEARARGTVSQFFQAPTAAQARAMRSGEAVSGGDFDDSCHVGVSPMRWRIGRQEGETLELVNEHGDTMVLLRESTPSVDWRALTRQAYERRVSEGT